MIIVVKSPSKSYKIIYIYIYPWNSHKIPYISKVFSHVFSRSKSHQWNVLSRPIRRKDLGATTPARRIPAEERSANQNKQTWVIKCPHFSHHPTIRFLWSTRWLVFLVMSNIPKMGQANQPLTNLANKPWGPTLTIGPTLKTKKSPRIQVLRDEKWGVSFSEVIPQKVFGSLVNHVSDNLGFRWSPNETALWGLLL